jgi:hypothetical protein
MLMLFASLAAAFAPLVEMLSEWAEAVEAHHALLLEEMKP